MIQSLDVDLTTQETSGHTFLFFTAEFDYPRYYYGTSTLRYLGDPYYQ